MCSLSPFRFFAVSSLTNGVRFYISFPFLFVFFSSSSSLSSWSPCPSPWIDCGLPFLVLSFLIQLFIVVGISYILLCVNVCMTEKQASVAQGAH